MSWNLEHRSEGWCVVKETDGSLAGIHPARADAIKQQRALYANESRVASMYAELDAIPDPVVADEVPYTSPVMAEILALLARDQQDKSLVASVAESQSLISQQFAESQEERRALVAALTRMGSPTINLPAQAAPEVTVNVPPAEVNFTAPAPEVTVNVPPAEVTVRSPDVNVTVEAPPAVQKTVTFERDPLTQQVTKAEVTEG